MPAVAAISIDEFTSDLTVILTDGQHWFYSKALNEWKARAMFPVAGLDPAVVPDTLKENIKKWAASL